MDLDSYFGIPGYGHDYREAYDITLSPAPEAAALAFGSEYVVVNETIRDCKYQKRSGYVLPRCSELWDARFSSASGEAPTGHESNDVYYNQHYEQQEERKNMRRNAFYNQYYDHDVYDI